MNKIKGLKGVKKAKKVVYLFACDLSDFKSYVGTSWFQTQSGITMGSTGDTNYIFCQTPDDIKEKRNITAEFSDQFLRTYINEPMYKQVMTAIEICNFEYTDHINPEHIPKVLRQIMAESPDQRNSKLMPMPCVGMVVRTNVDFPYMNVNKKDRGIVVGLYGSNLDCAYVMFDNSESCGFSREEQIEMLEYSHLTKHEHILNYHYSTNQNLIADYNKGNFDAEFYNLD